MRRIVFNVGLLFLAGALTGYCVLGRGTLSERAMSAYKAGDYQKALPLFKQMAARPEVYNDKQKLALVMGYVVDIEQRQKLSAGGTITNASMNPAAGNSPAGGETDQSK